MWLLYTKDKKGKTYAQKIDKNGNAVTKKR